MDTFALWQSTAPILDLLQVGCIVMGAILAIIAGAWLANRLAPFQPGDSRSVRSWERYNEAQEKLARVRARRRAITMLDEPFSDTTRPARKIDLDQTQPDLSLADLFWAERMQLMQEEYARADVSEARPKDTVKVSKLVTLGTLMCLSLMGCAETHMPMDTCNLPEDAGAVPLDDGSMPEVDGSMPEVDASDRDAATGGMCASLPHGPVSLPVVSSNCEGPFALAQSLNGEVRERTESGYRECILHSVTLRVICDSMYRDLPFTVGTLRRVGTTYTSEDTTLGCEGVTYRCHVSLDALTMERAVLCSLDWGETWCTIDLE